MSAAAGLSPKSGHVTWSRWESGDRKPSQTALRGVALGAACDYEWLRGAVGSDDEVIDARPGAWDSRVGSDSRLALAMDSLLLAYRAGGEHWHEVEHVLLRLPAKIAGAHDGQPAERPERHPLLPPPGTKIIDTAEREVYRGRRFTIEKKKRTAPTGSQTTARKKKDQG